MGTGSDQWELESWRAVVAQSADPHPFLTPEWQLAWWQHFGSGELSVLRLDAGAETVAVVALRRGSDGVLRFLGNREVTDYPGPAIAAGRAREAADLLVRRLRPGDVLELENARPHDGLVTHLEAAARAIGFDVAVEADEPVAILALPTRWDVYLADRSRHARHEIVRKRRRLEGARLRMSDAGTIERDLGTFFAFFRRARGDKKTFPTPRIERFMRTIAHTSLARGTLRLDLLEVDGVPLAVTLGFQGPRTYYLYNMAFDPAARASSPGIVLLTRLIERAIEDGLERFDFMRGLERYKLELGGAPSDLTRLRVTCLGARVDDVRPSELQELAWSGDRAHLDFVAGELRRRDRGELDYLAVRDQRGRAVGIGAIKWAHAPDAGYFSQLCTHPDQRRRGHMRTLMAAGEQRIRDRGLTWAALSVEVDNHVARALYERLGYEACGEGEESWEKTGCDGQPFVHICRVTHMRKRLEADQRETVGATTAE